jgi:crotonobetainyl-CoA:carnitine CoA-transferase CaiB-like acyl-CoA transferase
MTDSMPSSGKPPSAVAPLSGTVVIELGHSVAAPFAAQVLSDLGAEVIKIEKAGGDDARKWGPPFVDGSAAIFQALNRNKRSLVLDLRRTEHRDRLVNLIVERADIVLQNMRPGQVDELRLDASTLRGLKPSLIYCNMGAFGAGGPLSSRPGYDPLMQAFGGIMSVVGEPGSAPVRVGPSIVDIGSGLWAVVGIISSLLRRKETGEGALVDVSLLETAATWMCTYAAQYLASGQLPRKNGSGQAGIVPYRAYRTADGDLVVAAGNDSLFGALCRAVGHSEWAGDPRFLSNPLRVEHASTLYPMLEACFATAGSAEWIARLDAAGVPCAPVQTVGDLLAHPQLAALGLVQPVPGSSIPVIGMPVRFNGERPMPRSGPPALGDFDQ